jgi:hypothetical protein
MTEGKIKAVNGKQQSVFLHMIKKISGKTEQIVLKHSEQTRRQQ